MNTLSKTITTQFYKDANGFKDFEAAWKKVVNSELKYKLKVEDFTVYAILRGKDWRKGFAIPKHTDPSWVDINPIAVGRTFSSIRVMQYYPLDGDFCPHCFSFFKEQFGNFFVPDVFKLLNTYLAKSYRTKTLFTETDAYIEPEAEAVKEEKAVIKEESMTVEEEKTTNWISKLLKGFVK